MQGGRSRHFRARALAGLYLSRHFPRMRSALTTVAGMASAFLCASAFAADWQIIKQQGRDYVTFGNVAKFYQFPEYTRVSRTVSLRGDRRGIRAQAGTSELYINGVRFFTDFPLLSAGNEDLISAMDVSKIVEPVIRPNKIRGATKIETVVLDPGHGGTDQGTSNAWGSEKQYALDVALSAREQLLRAGYKVEMTRSSDVGVSLEERVNFANGFPNAVFISIHFNSSNGGAGVESYALAPAGVISNASNESHVSFNDVRWYEGNGRDEQNIALAAAVHATVLSRVSTFDRGVRHARFHVLRDIKIPAVLIEGGFLSNLFEAQRIATPQYRQQLGLAIAQAVQNFDRAVNFKASAAPSFAVAANNLPPHEHSITEPLDDAKPDQSAAASQPSADVTATH
jgi:N-acetylmuramoyl-L-alanine amidase